jgi:hypothetical protein
MTNESTIEEISRMIEIDIGIQIIKSIIEESNPKDD